MSRASHLASRRHVRSVAPRRGSSPDLPRTSHVCHLPQREILNPIRHILRIQHRADHFQIQHILAHGGGELMPVDEPDEEHRHGLACAGNGQKIVILTEQHTLERGRTLICAAL